MLFGVPEVFTPVYSNQHLPGFVVNDEPLKKHRFDQVVCLAANGLKAWAKTKQAENLIDFIADWGAHLTKALGLV